MSFLSGFSGALPFPRPHHAVPAAERQGAPVDSSERGACDLSPAPGSGLLAATPGLLPGGYCDAAPLPAAGGGVHRPKEPQVRHEVAVRDLGVRRGGSSFPTLHVSLARGSRAVHSYPIITVPISVTEIHGEKGPDPPSCFVTSRMR